jgi:hypothetical protein
MSSTLGRTRNFNKRIAIERNVLASANLLSERLTSEKLLGLSDAAISKWISGLSIKVEERHLAEIESAIKDLARGAGLLSDESRCAVAEGKVPADFPELLALCQHAFDAVA